MPKGFVHKKINNSLLSIKKKKNKNNFVTAATLQRYNEVKRQINQLSNESVQVDFKNSEYSENQEYRLPYSLTSAKTIIEFCIYFKNPFNLLTHNYFSDELNLYKEFWEFQEKNPDILLNVSEQFKLENSPYAKCQLSQLEYFDTLKIATWSYKNLVASAIFFYLENTYLKTLIETHNTLKSKPYKLKLASAKIALILLSPVFGSSVFKTIKQTNLFIKFPYDWVSGFVSFMEAEIDQTNGRVENCDRLLSIIDYKFHGDFSGFYYYLAAFDSIIGNHLINCSSTNFLETRYISIIYYILKQYQNA